MHKLTPLVLVLIAACSILLASPAIQSNKMVPSGVAHAQQNWRSEFDDLCGKTQEADALSVDELKQLIERCEKLKERIETLDETQRKVYLKRLQMCRDLFVFMLEAKEKNQP
jgi:hypothetical protein